MSKKEVKTKKVKIPVEISARHVHLSKKDLRRLFGKNYELEPTKTLSQPGEFATEETVDILFKNKKIHHVRVIGPVRKSSQIELSLSDVHKLGIDPLPKLKISGNTFGTTPVRVEGPKGIIKIPCIIPKRHVHMSEKKAKKLGIKNKKRFNVEIPGERSLIFRDVVVRVSKDYKTSMHLDTDEGNAAGIIGKGDGNLIIKNGKKK